MRLSRHTAPALAALLTLCLCGYASLRSPYSNGASKASVHIDLSQQHPVSPHLYGAFFEEINHAGEGGLYAEMVQDRSFDAMAHAVHFDSSSSQNVDVTGFVKADKALGNANKVKREASDKVARTGRPNLTDQRIPDWALKSAWHRVGVATKVALTPQAPLGRGNAVALQITSSAAHGETSGVTNGGYWGMALQRKGAYHISLYLRSMMPAANVSAVTEVSVLLQSSNGSRTYSRIVFQGVPLHWQRFAAEFPERDIVTDGGARLAVVFTGPGKIAVDVVSVMPLENVKRGMTGYPWPFRTDLLAMMKALQPKFLRFPGGCYVEGEVLKWAFRWKHTVGPPEERPGHWNLWGYWSTDGLGLFEYMQLTEELGAAPVWVINSGVSHQESIKPGDLEPWIQDALDSVEFVAGSQKTPWGAVRGIMGRPRPWQLPYIAIGNEDCGKPHYLANYRRFYWALKGAHPLLKLISNCDMKGSAPQDLYDWHMYTSPERMFHQRTAFDHSPRQAQPDIFVSEYAVTSGGGGGNLIGALSEAAFMTGIERNSDAVAMASYAPLMVHSSFRSWPTNLIVFDSSRVYGTVSYHVQQLFSQHQGIMSINTTVSSAPSYSFVAASATCSTASCEAVAIKVVNTGERPADVTLTVCGLTKGASVRESGDVTMLVGDNALTENSFSEPLKVAPVRFAATGFRNNFSVRIPPLAFTVMELRIEKSTTTA